MAKGSLPYRMEPRLLRPPDLREWLSEGHLALFLRDVVDTLDGSPILRAVFGQRKEARGFRRLPLRGLSSARAEFAFIALTHNLLKLFRSGQRAPALA